VKVKESLYREKFEAASGDKISEVKDISRY
jgi:hypothetical protein